MVGCRHPREVTSHVPLFPKPIIGIPIQGPFGLDDLPMKCFHSKELCDHYYSSLMGHRVEVEWPIDLRVFQDTHLPTIFLARGALCNSVWDALSSPHLDVLLKHPFYCEWAYVSSVYIQSDLYDLDLVNSMCLEYATCF